MNTAYPAPFIVGVGRSGTTMLRLMLDAHPEMAIPAETHFVPKLLGFTSGEDALRQAMLDIMTGESTWSDFGISVDSLRSRMVSAEPFDIGAGLRAFYRLYAEKAGKPRWGEKTPFYGRSMHAIEQVLPEARFIHIMRDGRDVALSLRPLWFSPGQEIDVQARNWTEKLSYMRAEGVRCKNYMEIRYEDLIADSAAVLRKICDFIELPYDEVMLRYHATAQDRLAEMGDDYLFEGRKIGRQPRLQIHANTSRPPDASRAGRWRTEMSAEEQRQFVAIAGPLLESLGYPV